MIRTALQPALVSDLFSRFSGASPFPVTESLDLHIVSTTWQKRPVILPFI
jgi:hypothetical protein